MDEDLGLPTKPLTRRVSFCCRQQIICHHVQRRRFLPWFACSVSEAIFILSALTILGFAIAHSRWWQKDTKAPVSAPAMLAPNASSVGDALALTSLSLSSARAVEKHEEVFFDTLSAPADLRAWAERLILPGNCTTKKENVLIASCCASSCGGFGDRVRGIPALLRFAEMTRRRLCIPQTFICAVRDPTCSEEKFAIISAFDLTFVRGVRNGTNKLATTKEKEKAAHLMGFVRNVASLHPLPLPEFGLRVGYKFINAAKVGMLALALSGNVNDVMMASRKSIRSALSLHTERDDYIALHIRVGGSPFNIKIGNETVRLERTTGADNGFNYSYPNQILTAFRKLPRDTVCHKAVSISTDSAFYRSALENVVPVGITCISCCGRAYHIDKRPMRDRKTVQQHLVDVQSFGSSARIFGTGGGFAIAGSVSRSWNAVPMQMISRASSQEDANSFVMDILGASECYKTSNKALSLT